MDRFARITRASRSKNDDTCAHRRDDGFCTVLIAFKFFHLQPQVFAIAFNEDPTVARSRSPYDRNLGLQISIGQLMRRVRHAAQRPRDNTR